MNRNAKINTVLLLLVAALAVLPLALGLGDHKKEPFTGSDAEAETAITEMKPSYEPWFSPLYEPPSGEIESALFALQAALGAGVLAYYFGIHRGRRQGEARARARLDGADGTGTVPTTPVSATATAASTASAATPAAAGAAASPTAFGSTGASASTAASSSTATSAAPTASAPTASASRATKSASGGERPSGGPAEGSPGGRV
ncbi:energy-coupling factor ABC transporter substrate-binding protein [Streptomyces sp. SID5476]|uniref:Cobalt transport protein CbiN n=1 Tax=Streptomyces bottropensis ATCC 25435 TaxID=1054862 RepID=M3F8I2_9ACTN|nr:energy-coupling factor ABC transporter substrate-binding protein [Streptomyces bottropensis]EMF57963.1 cbiN protein [Streptomyces bottropensis ATCC 25435]MZD18464.1 energy-coupling factor ABC transporter substrate-binding protein [Streptomyces sp. SID5476]